MKNQIIWNRKFEEKLVCSDKETKNSVEHSNTIL